jgi:hypothetical protein
MSGLQKKLQELYASSDDDEKAILMAAAIAVQACANGEEAEVQGFADGIGLLVAVSQLKAQTANEDLRSSQQSVVTDRTSGLGSADFMSRFNQANTVFSAAFHGG